MSTECIHDYSGKSVVVTGAASGMGFAIASGFARAGSSVVMGDVADAMGEQGAAEICRAGYIASYLHTDVSRDKDVENLIGFAQDTHGGLDVLVSAAGILGPRVNIDEQTPESLDEVFGVNVAGVVSGMRHAVLAFRKRNPSAGVVINVASVQGFRVLHPGSAFYAASKAAVVSLTKSGSLEFGSEGIRVVGIAPGAIDTPMLRSASGNTWPPRIVDDVPLARVGEPSEIADAALWLASEQASYVSGATLAVDGGFLSA